MYDKAKADGGGQLQTSHILYPEILALKETIFCHPDVRAQFERAIPALATRVKSGTAPSKSLVLSARASHAAHREPADRAQEHTAINASRYAFARRTIHALSGGTHETASNATCPSALCAQWRIDHGQSVCVASGSKT